MSWRNLALAAAAAAQFTCHQAILTAPPGSSVTLFANPTFIPANGGVSVISALLIEPAGTPVSDGTVIQCFTTLGRIDEQGKTNDGVARVNLVSDSRSGTANVTCSSGAPADTGPAPSPSPTTGPAPTPGGSGSGSVQVIIGSVLPARMFLTADPIRIEPSDPRESTIIATVFDASGNAAVNVPVIFQITSVTGGTVNERFEIDGAVHTDNSGRAINVLRTNYSPSSPSKQVTVTATTANGITATVVVIIN
jgi:hypothetical protein